MELIKKYVTLKNLLIFFFLLNFGIKAFNIQSNPSASTYDEVIYFSEAQSIVKYGTDLKGDWRPWHLEPSDSYYTELTSTLVAPGFFFIRNNPVLASKFIPLILGSLFPILLGLIAYRLRKDKSVFVVTTIIATLNPWIFQFSRMGYDSLFSITLYLLGIVFLLFFKDYKKLYAIIPLFLGFFQYQGHKVLLVPLIGIVLLYLYLEDYKLLDIFKKFKKLIKDKNFISSLAVFVFSLVLTVVYLVRLPHLTSGERISEFSFINQSELSSEVNDARRLSLSSPLNSLFINKYTVLTKVLAERFLNSYNLERLFIKGDAGVDTFTVLDSGYFHLIDILVISISAFFFFYKKKDFNTIIFLGLFLIFGAFPNMIRTGDPWIIFRGAFGFLALILLMGLGFSSFLSTLNKKQSMLMLVVYILLTTPFIFSYFSTYPISHTNNVGFYERVVANYIKRAELNNDVYIIPDRDDATFIYQIYYNNLLNSNNQKQVSQSMKTRKYEIDNLKIEGGCTTRAKQSTDSTTFVYFTKVPCEINNNKETTTEIKSIIDTGTVFTVYNDYLCSQYDLSPYPHITKNVMAVEKLSNEEFCRNFFSK